MGIEENLEILGLTEYDSKVLVSIIKLREGSAKDISLNSGVPYSRIYETINRLLKKNWIKKKDGRPALFYPGDIEEKINEHISNNKKMAEKIKINLRNLSHEDGYELLPTINIERDWKNFYKKVEELSNDSKQMTCVFGFYDPIAFDKINLIFKNKYYPKNLFVKNDILQEEFFNKLVKLSSSFQVRVLPFTPRVLLFLFDGKNIIIAMPLLGDSISQPQEIKFLEIRNFEIGKILEKMIEISFEESLPLENINSIWG